MIFRRRNDSHVHSFGDGLLLTSGQELPHRLHRHECDGPPKCPMPNGTMVVKFAVDLRIGDALVCDECGEGFVMRKHSGAECHVLPVAVGESRRQRRRRLGAEL